MANESGEWIMHGLGWDDPLRVRSWQELIRWIDEVGFLPLFKNEAAGFSVEEHTSDRFWWTGDPEQDPWEWRELIARSGQVAYGKFFGRKAGFISREWFPHFANWRRDGYDFDSRWDEALASLRSKKIMDRFQEQGEWFSYRLKAAAGFGKDGEKNFEGVITDLQMQGTCWSVISAAAPTRRASPTAGPSPCTPRRRPCGAMTTSARPTGWSRRNPGRRSTPMSGSSSLTQPKQT